MRSTQGENTGIRAINNITTQVGFLVGAYIKVLYANRVCSGRATNRRSGRITNIEFGRCCVIIKPAFIVIGTFDEGSCTAKGNTKRSGNRWTKHAIFIICICRYNQISIRHIHLNATAESCNNRIIATGVTVTCSLGGIATKGKTGTVGKLVTAPLRWNFNHTIGWQNRIIANICSYTTSIMSGHLIALSR